MLKITEHTLTNGIRAILVERQGIHALSLTYFLGGGSNEETHASNGLTHLLEHMLFTKTKRFASSRAMTRAVEAIGGNFNATTRKEEVEVYVTCHPSQYRAGLSILHEATFRAVFQERELAREKHVVIEELRGRRDDPGTRFSEYAAETLFTGSPHARSVGGDSAQVEAATLAACSDRLRDLLRRDRVVFVAAGAFDSDAMLAELERQTANVCLGPAKAPTAAPLPTARAFGHRTDDVQQAWLLGSLPCFGDTDPAWPRMHILTDILSSRLFHTARERHGLVYGIWVDAWTTRASGRLEFGCKLDPKNLPALLKDIRAELTQITREPVRAIELRNIIRRSHYGLDYMQDNASRLADWFAWQRLQHPTRAFRTPEAYDAIVRKTTRSDLLALAKKMFVPSKLSVITMAPGPLDPVAIARAVRW